jgi:hypothetical protein
MRGVNGVWQIPKDLYVVIEDFYILLSTKELNLYDRPCYYLSSLLVVDPM